MKRTLLFAAGLIVSLTAVTAALVPSSRAHAFVFLIVAGRASLPASRQPGYRGRSPADNGRVFFLVSWVPERSGLGLSGVAASYSSGSGHPSIPQCARAKS
jgi:hypothetical protein